MLDTLSGRTEYNIKALECFRRYLEFHAKCDLLPEDRITRETQSSDENILTLLYYIYIYIYIYGGSQRVTE